MLPQSRRLKAHAKDTRMSLNDQLKVQAAQLAPHFVPALLQRERTVFQFRFDDGDPFYLVVTIDSFEFLPGEIDSATLTLFLDEHDTCWQLLRGSIDGMNAFMEGKYRADGNIVLSQLLLYLFKSNDPTIAYQVQD